MEEITELNQFVKTSLESGEPFAFRPPARRHARPWAVPTLLAASLACALTFHSLVEQPAVAEPDIVTGLITLLSADDIPEINEADSTAELLLAWQDAPSTVVLSGASFND